MYNYFHLVNERENIFTYLLTYDDESPNDISLVYMIIRHFSVYIISLVIDVSVILYSYYTRELMFMSTCYRDFKMVDVLVGKRNFIE